MELPKLRLSGVTRLSSCSSPALRSVLGTGANGRVPVLRPLKCAGANKKVVVYLLCGATLGPGLSLHSASVVLLYQTDTQKDIKPHLKQYHLPTINRKGAEY